MDSPDSDRKDLLGELELMTKLKPHPHVIKLIGCVTDTGKIDRPFKSSLGPGSLVGISAKIKAVVKFFFRANPAAPLLFFTC